MKNNSLRCFIIAVSAVFVISDHAWAEANKPEPLQAIEFLSGFSKAKLHLKEDYRFVPLVVDLDFNLKKLTNSLADNYPGLLQFQLEPYLAPVYQPNPNLEFGLGFIFKVGLLPETGKLQPYLKAGPGMAYMTQHTIEQGTQFNFFEYGSFGFHYFFRKNLAFTLEYRFRHLSNCSVGHPNQGINSQFALAGLAYQF